MVENDLLTKAEALKYLRISNRTLYLLMKRHEFPYIKLGKRVLFRRTEIDAYLESKTIGKDGAKK
jgi:excisionase family DNA binding protein